MVASTLTPLAADVAHAGINTETILFASFTTQKHISSGQTPYSTLDLQGLIEFQLPTMSGVNNLFWPDLGLGVNEGKTIPCKMITGLSLAMPGVKIKCTATTIPTSASINNPVIITVSEFDEVPAGTAITIHLAGLKYVRTTNAPTITITTYQQRNRIRTDLESGTVSLNAGIAVPVSNSIAVTYSITNSTVNATNTLTINSFTTTVATGAIKPYLLVRINPSHDAGYCEYSVSLTCKVGATSFSCVCYPEIDMVLITMTATLAAGSRSISIAGLVNPESVPTTTLDSAYVLTLGNYNVRQIINFSTKLPVLTAGTL